MMTRLDRSGSGGNSGGEPTTWFTTYMRSPIISAASLWLTSTRVTATIRI